MVLENERFIVPPNTIPHVLDILDLTHTGFPKAYAFAKARYWFPDMKQLVEKKTTRQEVIELLGEPKQKFNKEYSVSYLYEYSDQLIALTFHEDVLLFEERAENDGRYDFKLVK